MTIANDPTWCIGPEGEELEKDFHKFISHIDDLLYARITTNDDAKAVMAELIDRWPVVWDMSPMGGEETWVEWVVRITHEIMVENFDHEHPWNRKPLGRPVVPYPDPD